MNRPTTSNQTGTTQQFYEALLQTETASAEYLVKFQDNILKDLLPFVAKHVPYYRDRLAPAFRADGSFNRENWTKLPILPAAEFKKEPAVFQPNELPAAHGRSVRYISSGSTGRPKAFYRSALSESAQNAAHYRHYRAFGLDLSRDLAMIRVFDWTLARSRPTPAHRSKIPWAAKWFARGNGGVVHTLSVFTPVAKQVEWLCGLGQVYLNTFPSNALAIARHVARNPGAKPQILAILAAGEPLTGEIRQQCAEHLGCSCVDIYSSAECGAIASDCPSGNVMHVQSELCRVEILDRKSNKPVRAGQWGRLIVTPLYNFAMPLIRYDTGDLVRSAAACSCGRSHRAIERSIGRRSNMLYLPGQEWFRPELTTMMEDLLHHRRWQLLQTGAEAFELHYMPAGGEFAINTRAVRAALKNTLGARVSIQIRPIAALGPSSSGKFTPVLNHFRI